MRGRCGAGQVTEESAEWRGAMKQVLRDDIFPSLFCFFSGKVPPTEAMICAGEENFRRHYRGRARPVDNLVITGRSEGSDGRKGKVSDEADGEVRHGRRRL